MHKPLSFYTMLVCKNVCITCVYVHGRSSASKKTKIDFPSQSDASSSPQFFSSLTRYYSFPLYPIYHPSQLSSLYPSSSCPLIPPLSISQRYSTHGPHLIKPPHGNRQTQQRGTASTHIQVFEPTAVCKKCM